MSEKNKKLAITLLIASIVVVLVWFLIVGPLIQFKKSEKEVLNAGKRYFEVNPTQLPIGNRVKTIPLKTLYNKDFIKDDIKVPNSNNTCSENQSFVKVKKNGDSYKYIVYLKCGIYSSKVDHKGPRIILKGEESITINKGDKFSDPGIDSVEDDTDGKMDIKDVKVKSNVNVDKNGTYEIRYSIKDSFDNKTEVVRVVKVVQILDKVVKSATDKTNYYKGTIYNNYIKLDGILFNIVGLNDDGSVKVTSSEPLAMVDYNSIDDWLNDYFYNNLSDNVKKYIKTDSKWCNEEVSNTNNYTKCNSYGKAKAVGLLSVADINNSKDSDGASSLLGQQSYWLGNQNDKKAIKEVPISNSFDVDSKGQISGVRPTLNLKSNLTISSGSGTDSSPYIIKGTNNKLKPGSKISDVRVGEYISYSGNIWRTGAVDKNGNVQMVLDDTVSSDDNYLLLGFGIGDKYYSIKTSTNLGYQVVNTVSKYVSTKKLVNQNINIYKYNGNASYKTSVSSDKYKVKLAEVSMFEMFSTSLTNSYWFRETDGKGNAYFNSSIGDVGEYAIIENNNNMVRLSVLLNGGATVKLGSGTKDEPYTIAG